MNLKWPSADRSASLNYVYRPQICYLPLNDIFVTTGNITILMHFMQTLSSCIHLQLAVCSISICSLMHPKPVCTALSKKRKRQWPGFIILFEMRRRNILKIILKTGICLLPPFSRSVNYALLFYEWILVCKLIRYFTRLECKSAFERNTDQKASFSKSPPSRLSGRQ